MSPAPNAPTPDRFDRYRQYWRLAGFALLAVALVVLPLLSARQLHNAVVSPAWPQTEGRVTHSMVDRERRGSEEYGAELHVWYTYQVDGQSYRGTVVTFGRNRVGEAHMRAVAARYPVGATVRPYYDPADPSVAVLEPGLDAPGFWNATAAFLFFEGFFILPACGFCFVAARYFRRQRDNLLAAATRRDYALA